MDEEHLCSPLISIIKRLNGELLPGIFSCCKKEQMIIYGNI